LYWETRPTGSRNAVCRSGRFIFSAIVEPVARRWERLEAALVGRPLDPAQAAEVAAELADEFTGRDSVELPAWYRVSVLPSLVRRAAVAALDS